MHTDEGLTSVGETRMLGHTDALLGYLREAEVNHILGSDPFAVEDLVKRMKYGDYGRAGEIVMSGIAVIEMACWDIKGKALCVPVWQLLGGKVTDKVKAYANGWYTTEARRPSTLWPPPSGMRPSFLTSTWTSSPGWSRS
ncbi:L-alanine-DL-glutamate epimerase-like enolase superfamily enzyme [Streptomyces luteogriseus]|nr:L-alanine-DL-glutamate epimerase-like enolase superfamily enzyme [Streptomyces luteogriseus]